MRPQVSSSKEAASVVSLSSAPSEWVIDSAHTGVHFSVRHMMVSTVRGEFQKVSGTVQLDEQDLTRSTVNVEIDASSIHTRDEKRDGHLKSPDFFDVAQFPKLTFKSTRIEKAGDGGLKVTGDLTLRGVTRPIVLEVDPVGPAVKNPWGQWVRGVSATAKLNRKDFGLNWNQALEAGGILVGEEVKLHIEAELNPKQ